MKQRIIRPLVFSFSPIDLAIWWLLVVFSCGYCKISNFNKWTTKPLSQASCTEFTLLTVLTEDPCKLGLAKWDLWGLGAVMVCCSKLCCKYQGSYIFRWLDPGIILPGSTLRQLWCWRLFRSYLQDILGHLSMCSWRCQSRNSIFLWTLGMPIGTRWKSLM